MSEHDDIHPTDQPPTPDPALRRLDFLVGTWRIEGETAPEFAGPHLTSSSTETFEWLDGGFFLEHRWDAVFGEPSEDPGRELPGGPVQKGVMFYGFDVSTGRYRTHFFDGNGPFHEGSMYEGEVVHGYLRFTGPARFTLVEHPDGTVTNDWELRGDDGVWRPWRHTTMTRIASPTSTTREDGVDVNWTLEVVCVPVSDVDRAKAFYAEQLGFAIDHDTIQGEDVRVVQLTPPGSGCSIVVGRGAVPDMPPGSLQGLQLVVPDIRAAHAELVERGVDVTDVQVYGPDGLRPSRDGDALDNVGFFFFGDPDGNGWAVQQISARAG